MSEREHSPEIDAIATVLRALVPLTWEERRRVITYATRWTDDMTRQTTPKDDAQPTAGRAPAGGDE